MSEEQKEPEIKINVPEPHDKGFMRFFDETLRLQSRMTTDGFSLELWDDITQFFVDHIESENEEQAREIFLDMSWDEYEAVFTSITEAVNPKKTTNSEMK